MILKDLKLFPQKVQKNKFIINLILEINYDFDIIFIQEPSWTTIRSIPSLENCEGISLVGISNHPNWLTFARESNLANDSPRVIIYVNIRLSSLRFSLYKDIINHRDILLVYFSNNNVVSWIMNVYSDSAHFALKYLKSSETNIPNLLIMTGDFNIWDSIWDLSFPHHSSISDNLIIIADSFNLDLSVLTNQVSTRYSDTVGKANFVIDLMFLRSGSSELNNHSIHPDWQLTSDHTLLTVSISIVEENINSSKFSIMKNSEEEAMFIKEVSFIIKNLDVSDLFNINKLENVVNTLASNTKSAWRKNSKRVNITRHSKSWWNKNCNWSLRNYRLTRTIKNWKIFKKTVKFSK